MDNLETATYFPTAVYSIEKKEFLAVATAVFDEAIGKNTNPMNELYPVKMTDNLYLDPRMKDLAGYISSTAWNILDSQGYKMDDKVTYFTAMWGQQHHKFSAMDDHFHGEGVQIVGFYFLNAPENASNIVIDDPRQLKSFVGLGEADTSKVTYATNKLMFPVKEGSLFFTNSWVPHSFTRHGSDEPLKFIHFNLSVQEQGPIIV
jgi:Putative 2OG-Fe(II) oxygenase